MLNTVFYFILNMSITSSFVIAALLIIRQIRPLPRRVIYPLWALAFFRLVTPFALSTSLSLFNFTGGLVKRLITVETVSHGTVPVPVSERIWAMNLIGAAEEYAPVEYKTEALRQVFTTAAVIWAGAAAAMFITVFILYVLTGKELKKAVQIEGGIYRSDIISSPVSAGLIHTRIVLPATLDPAGAEGKMVLAHENVHKHRSDNLWRLFGVCITCIYWFNPFVWVMMKSFFTDMEQSCDEAVIKKYNAEERKIYAETLLRFAEEKRLFVSAAFGRSGVKLRIVNVLNYKKLTVIGAVSSSLFLLAAAAALVTNPQLRG
ncbi:MAG: M56 family metallopeptidase [Oscillospiraceae bacterium]|nr:M56 family metallopeptidase [Oscillospiraceae bacterium]